MTERRGCPWADEFLDPRLIADLGLGRSLFNQGDFWGAHEALEAAWQRSSDPNERELLQGLIQASAAFHKLLVQDNSTGALQLFNRSLDKLGHARTRGLGIALRPLRAHLERWRERLLQGDVLSEPVVGLPEINWSRSLDEAAIRIEGAEICEVRIGDARCVLVTLRSGENHGIGECRSPWGHQGTWEALHRSLIPGLLTEHVRVPSEMALVWREVSEDAYARAGLEAALWDLWADRQGLSLRTAFGHAERHVDITARLPALGLSAMQERAEHLLELGFEHLVLPARPKADRRLIPALVANLDIPFGIELSGRYREADILALQHMARSGPAWLADPSPTGRPKTARRLRRWLDLPIVRSAFKGVEETDEMIEDGQLDVLRVGVDEIGPDAARRLLDHVEGLRLPAFVSSRSITAAGLAMDLAIAAHPAAVMPLELVGRGVDDLPLIRPEAEGATSTAALDLRNLASASQGIPDGPGLLPDGAVVRRRWRIEA